MVLQDLPLSCLASIDNVAYSWRRVGDTIPSRSQGQNSNTFIIPRVTPHDEGMYYCVATKEGVVVESNRATVRVDGEEALYHSKTDHVGMQNLFVFFDLIYVATLTKLHVYH